jgi:hypothetical protein
MLKTCASLRAMKPAAIGGCSVRRTLSGRAPRNYFLDLTCLLRNSATLCRLPQTVATPLTSMVLRGVVEIEHA